MRKIFLIISFLIILSTFANAEHYFVVDDQAPANDVVFMTKLVNLLKPGLNISQIRLNSQVSKNDLNNRVTVFIYYGYAMVIVGDTSPADDVILATNIINIFKKNFGIDTGPAKLSSEITNDDLRKEIVICADSDGGIDYYTKGYDSAKITYLTQTGDALEAQDGCGNDGYLYEYYCDSSYKIKFKKYICPNGCKDGACIKYNIDLKLNEAYLWSSYDPRETSKYVFGLDVCVFGNTNINDLKNTINGLIGLPFGYRIKDIEGNVAEGSSFVSGIPEELKNGECTSFGTSVQQNHYAIFDKADKITFILDPKGIIQETNEGNNEFEVATGTQFSCTDSDGGKNYYVKGKAQGGNSYYGPQEDFCFDYSKLGVLEYEDLKSLSGTGVIEHYCDSYGNVANEGYKCPTGYTCQDGACISGPAIKSYRYAYWQCHDGYKEMHEDATSCKSSEIWRKYAEESCANRCSSQTGKCGINSFSVSNECASSQQCTDSDGGKNYYVKGTVYTPFEFNDRCEPDGLLKEYYCQSNGEEGFERYDCPNGCQDGACLQAALPKKATVQITNPYGCPTCIYSGDVDEGSYILLNPASPAYEVRFIEYDESTGKANFKVNGFQAYNIKANEEVILPDNAIFKYLSITDACIDTDGGENYYMQGKAYSGENVIYDKCIFPECGIESECIGAKAVLSEAYCGPDGPTSKMIECENDCQDGTCTPISTCTDTDGGIEPNIEGKAYSDSEVIYDECLLYKCLGSEKCVGVAQVKEAYCGPDGPTSKLIDCSYDCQNNACIPSTPGCNNNNICEPQYDEDYSTCPEDCSQPGQESVHISAIWANQYSISQSSIEKITIYVKVVDKDGSPAEPSEGIETTIKIKNTKEIIPIKYNSRTGYYEHELDIAQKPVGKYIIEPIVKKGLTYYFYTGDPLIIEVSPGIAEKCPLLGYRENGKFCNIKGYYEDQRAAEDICENNFECKTNSCLDGKCTSPGFWQNLFEWLSKIFG